jgi:hypothetical protein
MQAINDIQADSDLAITSSADGTALAWYRRPPLRSTSSGRGRDGFTTC